ncbi:MAG: sugar transporter ATP-binding protein [Streptosporangiaceae bacterium]|jgi:ABC-type sugar transport system ATPase subunit|nr:sugar transporter ATP-binding protein [Streptosporangiaceae bacterium]
MSAASTLILRGVQKSYGETKALAGLDLEARGGQILGVAGPNGAGKSTLVKVLAGETDYDSGEISFRSAEGELFSVRPTAAVVHQETSLFPNLSVAENVFLARSNPGWRYPKAGRRETEVLEEMRLAAYADKKVSQCSLVVRQLTEIARALLVGDADVFLFDEPNSALTAEESELLFQRILRLRDEGRVVLLVSHRLSDLVEYCDSVVVVRDGRVGRTLRGEDLTEVRIAEELVVGIEASRPAETEEQREKVVRTGKAGAKRAFEIRDWTHATGRFSGVSLQAPCGKITALVGAEGSGARELLRSLAGLEPASGVISDTGQGGAAVSPGDTEYMPAERQVSLFSNFDVGENLVARLGSPHIANKWGFLRRSAAAELERELADRFRVRGPGLRASIRALSGGNQQKVAIAGAVAKSPAFLALEEPTRGVDVGSTAEIYGLLGEYVEDGGAAVCYCTEVPEVFEMADTVIVFDGGRVVGTHEVSEFSDVAALAHQIAQDVVTARSGAASPPPHSR